MTKKTITFLATVLAAASLQAQPTLGQCREMARRNYPQIRQYGLIAQTEQYSLSNAAKAWLPQVTLGAQATLQNKVPSLPEEFEGMVAPLGIDMKGLRKDQYRIAAEVSQVLWDGGKSRADREMARAEAEEQRGSADVDLHAVEGRVDDLYFGILLLDNNLDQTEAARTLLRSNLEKVQSLVRNGAATQSDADALEAELLTVGQSIAQIRSVRESYRKMLETFIGEPLEDRPLKKPPMPPEPVRDNNRPELDYLDASIRKLDAQRRLLDVATMPQVGLFAQGYYGYPGYDYFGSMMDHGWSLNGLVGIRAVWNLGPFYTKAGNRGRLETAKELLVMQKDIFLFNTGLQATRQDDEIARLRSVLKDDRRIAELRSSVRKASESKLRNGTIDTNDLLKAITDEKEALLNLNGHEIGLLKASYELKHTLNR